VLFRSLLHLAVYIPRGSHSRVCLTCPPFAWRHSRRSSRRLLTTMPPAHVISLDAFSSCIELLLGREAPGSERALHGRDWERLEPHSRLTSNAKDTLTSISNSTCFLYECGIPGSSRDLECECLLCAMPNPRGHLDRVSRHVKRSTNASISFPSMGLLMLATEFF